MTNIDTDTKYAIIIDLDDTVLDIGDRRLALYKKHFTHAFNEDDDIKSDVSLQSIGDRSSSAAASFMQDFTNPNVLKNYPVKPIKGATDAIFALEQTGFRIVLLTGRHETLRELTLNDLAAVNLDWKGKDLVMCDQESPIDPSSELGFQEYKINAISRISENLNVIAMIGDRSSDIVAAFENSIPAILLSIKPNLSNSESLSQYHHVGFEQCKTWSQVLVCITSFWNGEKQLEKLRDSFTRDYSSWLNNLNNLCAIDVAVAAVISVVASGGILETSLHWVSRVAFGIPLFLALIALVFAIRAFTSRYTSGPKTNTSIVPKFMQALRIFFDIGKSDSKAREKDAINEYYELRKQSVARQSVAHRVFFYQRYGTHNPKALMNLRMFEMRSVNYVRAYAEHLSSMTLIYASFTLVICIIFVALFDPSLHTELQTDTNISDVLLNQSINEMSAEDPPVDQSLDSSENNGNTQ